MRRLHVLLVTAGLLTAPTSAVAGPDRTKDGDHPTETFEWSMATSQPRLGVMVVGLTPELRTYFGAPADRGVIVGRVEPGSAAAAAGLAIGDVLTAVRGAAIDSGADVLAALASDKKGDAVMLSVIRDRKPMTLSATLLNDAGAMTRREPHWPRWIRKWMRTAPDRWAPLRAPWQWWPPEHAPDGQPDT